MLKRIIALEGIEIIAPIGYYKEERIKRNTFLIDIIVEQEIDGFVDSDDIKNTLNYEKLFDIVQIEMAVECQLIENAAERIYKRISTLGIKIFSIHLIIRKKDPPLKGKVKYSRVELKWIV